MTYQFLRPYMYVFGKVVCVCVSAYKRLEISTDVFFYN